MLLVVGGGRGHMSREGQGWVVPGLMFKGGAGLGALYSEVQCMMSNGHMGTPCGQNDRQTRLKTLFSCNFVGGR